MVLERPPRKAGGWPHFQHPTFTMPDTAENQAAYPQQKGLGPGLGFPVARVCTILSLATACVTSLTPGRYQGK